MSETLEASPTQLNQEQLLSAIDSEISHREAALSNHGINTWGVGGAIVGLLWLCVTEITENSHTWLNTTLVFYVGQMVLFLLVGSFTNHVGKLFALPQPTTRESSFHRQILQSGFNPKTLPDFIGESFVLLIVSMYLALNGHAFLGWVGAFCYFLLILFLLLGWALCRMHAPLISGTTSRKSKIISGFARAGFLGLLVMTHLVAVWELWRSWPILSKPDIHLGLIFAGLLVFVSFARRFVHPPIDLHSLRSLRTRLAFGLVDVGVAKREAENILLGPPRNHYLTVKAEQAIAAFEERKRDCEELINCCELLICMANKLKEMPDDKVQRDEACSRHAKVFRGMVEKAKAQEVHLLEGRKFAGQLKTRIKLATVLHDLPKEDADDAMNRVREAGKSSDEAMQKFRDRIDAGIEAGKWLSDNLKDANLPKPASLTKRELLTALFSE